MLISIYLFNNRHYSEKNMKRSDFMNNRERFLGLFEGKPIDRIFNMEIAIWPQTAYRWVQEGLPLSALGIPEGMDFFEGIKDNDLILMTNKPIEYFTQLNGWIEMTEINTYKPMPPFEEIVYEDDGRTRTYRDDCGNVIKILIEGSINECRLSMDQHLSFPVKNRADFLDMKRRYIANIERLSKDWSKKVSEWNDTERAYPLSLFYIGHIGFYSMLRRWMGTEDACCIFYEDESLATEMMEFIADYMIELIRLGTKDVKQYDLLHIFEDMCFNTGPLVSPSIFKKFFVPCYKRVIDEARKHCINHVYLDSDGDVKPLLPMMIDCGVDIIGPLEVKANADPITMRKQFGGDIGLIGGLPKILLSDGHSKEEIERGVREVLDYMLPRGRYLPTLDHSVPPDVSLENFKYYLEVKEKCLLGK